MRTIDKIITKKSGKYGAPLGRPNVGVRPITINLDAVGNFITVDAEKIYDCAVPMSSDGAYDKGGAYWGVGKQLRVSYTKDLSYVEFYRAGEQTW